MNHHERFEELAEKHTLSVERVDGMYDGCDALILTTVIGTGNEYGAAKEWIERINRFRADLVAEGVCHFNEDSKAGQTMETYIPLELTVPFDPERP